MGMDIEISRSEPQKQSQKKKREERIDFFPFPSMLDSIRLVLTRLIALPPTL